MESLISSGLGEIKTVKKQESLNPKKSVTIILIIVLPVAFVKGFK